MLVARGSCNLKLIIHFVSFQEQALVDVLHAVGRIKVILGGEMLCIGYFTWSRQGYGIHVERCAEVGRTLRSQISCSANF